MTPSPDSASTSSTQRKLSRRGQIWMGVMFVAAGLLPIALAVGVIRRSRARMRAPAWVVFLAGCCFSLVGTVLILPERAIRLRGFLVGCLSRRSPRCSCGLVSVRGSARFRSGFSIGPASSWSVGGEIGGRLVFGLAGVLIAAFAVWAWVKWLRSCAAPSRPRAQPTPSTADLDVCTDGVGLPLPPGSFPYVNARVTTSVVSFDS